MKYKNSLDLFTINSNTGWDKNFNSSVGYLTLSIDKGDYFKYETLSKKDWSAFKTPSFRKGAKHYAIKHR